MTQILFIGATGTDIGKTYVTCLLLRELRDQGLRVRAIKPVISGFTDDDIPATDTGQLLQAMGEPPTLKNARAISPWRYADPLPPHLAARQAGQAIDFQALLAFCRKEARADLDYLLIEGVGGIMVPLDEIHTTLDLLAALGCPCLLVAGSYLGTLSHSLTTINCILHRGIEIKTLVISESLRSYADFEIVYTDFTRLLPRIPIKKIRRHEQNFGLLTDVG